MGQRLRLLVLISVLLGLGILLGPLLPSGDDELPQTLRQSTVQGIPGRVRVEVLNGSGVAGIAWDATRALRDAGFDVVLFGNAGTYSDDPSVVMDRVGQVDTARLVAETLGIAQVLSEPDSTLFVDVTVRLGPDWTGPPSALGNREEAAAWWDLRRFFGRRETP